MLVDGSIRAAPGRHGDTYPLLPEPE